MQFRNIYKRLCNKVLSRIDKTDLTYDEAIEIYNRENAVIIDVRSPEEYRERHLTGAINIPILYPASTNLFIASILPDRLQ